MRPKILRRILIEDSRVDWKIHHIPGLNLTPPEKRRQLWPLSLLMIVIASAGTIGATPPSKGDLSPPPRVRWAEPGDQLPEELNFPVEPKPKVDEKAEPAPVEDLEPRVIGTGFGSMGRVSYLGGKTFGRNDSMTPLEAMPYLLTDEYLVFADIRGFITNRSKGGESLGAGFRRLFEEKNAWAGASVWYDGDQSTGKMFQQVGLSFEGLIQQYEFRSNVYLPVTSSQIYSNTITSSSIVGNQLLYTRTFDTGNALRGVDFEAGYSLPVMDRHVIRGYIGGYHFEGGAASGVNGFKARTEAVINNMLTAQLLFTNDNLYGSNLMVGVSMQFPFGKNHPTTGWIKNTPSPFRFVERNYNVIVSRFDNNVTNQVATDPTTGNAYVVDQVYSPAYAPALVSSASDGTAANPYFSVKAAQDAGANVIVVQNGSVLNESISLTSGQHLFGQGAFAESLATTGGGHVPIPTLMQIAQEPTLSLTPVIQNVNGDAITLASNSEVAGFQIVGTNGNGISGTGVSGVSLHDLSFASIGADAINLTNSTGQVTIGNIEVASSLGNGIVLNGGHPNLVFSGGGGVITAQGNGFVLENMTGGTAALGNLLLTDIGGTGLVMNNAATDVTIDSLTVSQSGLNGTGGAAVAISGITGSSQTINGASTMTYHSANFNGVTKIDSPSGVGFSVNGSDAKVTVANLNVSSSTSLPAVSLVNASSPVTIGNLTLNTQNSTGLVANHVTSLQINGGSVTTANAPAFDVASTGFNANLRQVSVNGGPYGIKIEGSTGNFVIAGNGSYASGGTIQNTTAAGVSINSFGKTNLSWVDFVNNATSFQSLGSNQVSLSNLRISGSTGYAIDSLNDLSVSLNASTLKDNGAVGGGSIRIQASTVGQFTTNITNNTITDSNGTAIQLLTQASGAGSTLTTGITSNTLSGYKSGSQIVSVNWTGPVTANIASNIIYAYGSNMTGVLLEDSSTTSLLTATVTNNSVYFANAAASSGNGIWIIDGQSGGSSTGRSTLTLTSNLVDFKGTGGTGLRFGLYETSTDSITSNNVVDHAGGATGILYDYAAAGSNLTMTSNSITLLDGDPTSHRGIIFLQAAPTVTLNFVQGSPTNWVYNTASVSDRFSIPNGTGVGGILIDGTFFVPPK